MMLEYINTKLTGGGCPKAGSLGECAATYHIHTLKNLEVYEAYIYLWDDSFEDFSQIGQWFLDNGAKEAYVTWVMFSTLNGDRDGKTEDGARAVIVTYYMGTECDVCNGSGFAEYRENGRVVGLEIVCKECFAKNRATIDENERISICSL